MKIFSFLCVSFVCLFLFNSIYCFSDDVGLNNKNHIKYKVVDIGTLGADESVAFKINENGQILGCINDKGKAYTFVWSIENKLELIDLPLLDCNDVYGSINLNNSGQIYGVNKQGRSFIWDRDIGYYEIGTLGGSSSYISASNDKGQLIGSSSTDKNISHAFFYDKFEMIDLTELFINNIPGNWRNVYVSSLDNIGNVVVTAEKQVAGTNNYVHKSFIWKSASASFKMLLPEKSHDTSIYVNSIDDKGNMLAQIRPFGKQQKTYFISPSEGINAYLYQDGKQYILRNNRPVCLDCLPGKLKKDVDGNYYFGPGLKISKILVDEYPFYDVGNTRTTRIYDQNSKGQVVGRINTLYPGFHAFLAFPVDNEITE